MGLEQLPGSLARRRFRILPLVLLVFVLSSRRGVYGDQEAQPVEMVEQFKAETVFWKQLEIGQRIAVANDREVLPLLEPFLAHSDRHVRGNTAFVFGSLGDPRGLEVIAAILGDRSDRPEGQGVACARRSCWSVPLQIAADRYYAVHLLGELKDPRAVPMLVSFLDDPDINHKIPWALHHIGGKSAIEGLINALRSPNPQVRVYAIEDLEDIGAVEALPELLPLLSDAAMGSYDPRGYVTQGITVGEAARTAIATLQKLSNPGRQSLTPLSQAIRNPRGLPLSERL